jgi:ribosome-associated protein
LATTKKRTGAEGEKPKKAGTARAGAAKRTTAVKRAAAPRIRSSHAGRSGPGEGAPSGARAGAGEGAPSGARKRPAKRAADAGARGPADRPPRARREPQDEPATRQPPQPAAAPARKSLAAPKRAGQKRAATPPPQPSDEARELALALAAAGLDKKAMGVEILEVTGRVDYTDYLVIMTGRSDRHVHAIATGIEEALRQKKMAPLSMEGLGAATWVLIDFGDAVVHVFQEDTRRLYDIEGLWMDAGRVPVPGAEGEFEGGLGLSGPATVTRILPG